MEKRIYTFGYTGHGDDLAGLVKDLKERQVSVLVDVRSNPYSSAFSQYNKEPFAQFLREHGIVYRNYADEFGAKQMDKGVYSDLAGDGLRIDYEKFTSSKKFKEGVEKLNRIYGSGRKVALMCSEKDPINCHRAIMIGNALQHDGGFDVIHIVRGKSDETQEELELRMKESISDTVTTKKKTNKLEEKLKHELELVACPTLFEEANSQYIDDIKNYYRIINSHIGWKLEEVMGW